jgi:D-alanine--poly(phosphoribitol) ligase subunit 2
MNAMASERSAAIRQYMQDAFLFEFGGDVQDDTDLFENGLIDSYGLVEFIAHLEQTYGVKFAEADITSPELVSFRGILNLVETKLHQT